MNRPLGSRLIKVLTVIIALLCTANANVTHGQPPEGFPGPFGPLEWVLVEWEGCQGVGQ